MQATASIHYWIAPSTRSDEIDNPPLPNELHPVSQRARRGELKLYDSFDWRLWFGGLALYRLAGCYHLLSRSGFRLDLARPDGSGYSRPINFAEQFREPELRQPVQRILAPRALIEIASFHCRERSVQVRNGDDKGVALLHCFELSHPLPDGRQARLEGLWIAPCIGYQLELEMIEATLRAAGWQHEMRNPLELLLPAAQQPRPERTRPLTDMVGEEPADDLLRRLLLAQLRVVKEQEDGIIKQIDSEFLHDYRVALRKARSLLSLAKRVFPAAIQQRARHDFADLQRQSNQLRDLDVWLLQREHFQKMVPPRLQTGFEQLFAELQATRNQAQRRLRRLLVSSAHQLRMQQWLYDLAQPGLWEEPAEVKRSARALIDRQILRRHRQLLKGAQRFSQLDDEEIHDLRIEGKKLRYLLEIFSDFYSPEPCDWLLTHLRKVQGRLGDYNDLQVQQTHLQHFAETLIVGEKSIGEVLLAAGAIVAGLEREKQQARKRIAEPLHRLATPNGRAQLQQLLNEQ